jgi:uncharacterized OsmC-like protein
LGGHYAGATVASETFEVVLTRETGYRFAVELDDGQEFVVDEFPPVGRGEGPNPARLLATAVGHCLSASLVFCLARSRIALLDLRTTVEGRLERNERGRVRIGGLRVRIEPVVTSDDLGRIGRCLEVFEDYCVVTESVRKGIPVVVEVEPRAGVGAVVSEAAEM